MVKLVILLLTGPFIEFNCSRYRCLSERVFFYLEIYGKLTGLSNQFEPSMVFDPSEFEGPRFDCILMRGKLHYAHWERIVTVFL
jgi:hypothetical protein